MFIVDANYGLEQWELVRVAACALSADGHQQLRVHSLWKYTEQAE